MTGQKENDAGLEILLSFDREIFVLENGYWVKFEAKKVTPTEQIPHGIKYSLTLHDTYNRRVIGYDNAHKFKSKRKRYVARKSVWDHRHNGEDIEKYEFECPYQLMKDFWSDVDEVI